jgi:predicted PurR-regulated permease PerM
VALLQGIVTATLFSFYGIKYALLMGLFAALFDLIPYFGLIVMIAISAVVAAFSDPPVLQKIVLGAGSIWALHIFETAFLSPRIVGSKMGLHPLLMILSLLVFMYFLGFIGLLIAVPTTALLILFIKDWELRRKGGSHVERDSSLSPS